jgi:hypothetical protein
VTDNPKLARSTNGRTGDEDGPVCIISCVKHTTPSDRYFSKVPSKDANREHSIPRTKEVWFAGCHSDMYTPFFDILTPLSLTICDAQRWR